jgi:fluoride exporter
MIKNLLLVGLGGALGSMLRYLTSYYINKRSTAVFPWGTFAVNMAGCLLIGVLAGIVQKQPWAGGDFKYLFITGFCGGYTTFSTFAHENTTLFSNGNYSIALTYIAASIVLGMAFVWVGMAIAKTF